MRDLLGLIIVTLAIPASVHLQETCTNGQVYRECGSACPPTCEQPDPFICTANCVSGCFCPSGMFERGGSCFSRSDCLTISTTPPPPPPPPPPTVTVPSCTNGKVYQSCRTACPLTCERQSAFCSTECLDGGCVCPLGLVEHNGACINSSDCPVTVPPCTNGKVHQTCGTACPLTCLSPPPLFCSLQCVIGCFCPAGLAEHNEGCIAPSDCPVPTTPPPTPVTVLPPGPSCTNGKVYQSCRTACPLTCERQSAFCSTKCLDGGCVCPLGLVEHNGACINSSDCPVSTLPPPPVTTQPPACANGMVYRECGTACPLSCESPDPRPCPLYCVRGCFCPYGLFENNGACVNRSDCSVSTPPPPPVTTQPPACANGMVYRECGTFCPLSCESPDPRPCPLICVRGCFCPYGLFENNGACVNRSDCPVSITTPPPVTTPPPPVSTPPPACTNGMVFNECGTACPLSCEFPNPRPCTRNCVRGCFCPPGLLENNGACVNRSDCPVPTTSSPTVCPVGMEYRECGPLCPLRCSPILGCFSLRCVPGCFCPEDRQYLHNGQCVAECPTATPPPPVIDACATVFCVFGTNCQVSNITGDALCLPDCQRNNGGCRKDQTCETVTYPCNSDDGACDPHVYANCKDPLYVYCGGDAFLACDSEWTVCLQQNKTRRASCVSSCLSQNGNCGDKVCTTSLSDNMRLQCLDIGDIPSDCPAGQVMNECGNLCQETCQQNITGNPLACALVCGPPACVCPPGQVLFRDRCVDPRLCYSLVTDPPAIKPLPVVDPNTVFVSLGSALMLPREFTTQHKENLLDSIRMVLYNHDISDVTASVHGIQLEQQTLKIVVQISGSSISKDSADHLAFLLSQNTASLSIVIQEVVPVKVVYVDKPSGLSMNVIIAIAASSAVAGVAVIAAWIAVVACCCVLRKKTAPSQQQDNIYSGEKPIMFTEFKAPENDVLMDTEKGKLVIESLYH